MTFKKDKDGNLFYHKFSTKYCFTLSDYKIVKNDFANDPSDQVFVYNLAKANSSESIRISDHVSSTRALTTIR